MRIILYVLCFILSTNIYANDFFQEVFSLFHASEYHEELVDEQAFPAKRPPNARTIFVFDPKKFIWAVYNKQGDRVGMGNASGGKDYCPDINESCRTVVGEYTVFRKEDKDCTSKTFPIDEGGGAAMPHCMFFYKGYAIHGSKHLAQKNLSHGCIRVSEKAAAWMNENYIHEGSLVIVKPY